MVPAEAGTVKRLEPQVARNRVGYEREHDGGGHASAHGREHARSALAFDAEDEPDTHTYLVQRGGQRPGLGWTPPGPQSLRTIRNDACTTECASHRRRLGRCWGH